MSISTAKFHPSVIEDEIYDILDSNPNFIISSTYYTHDAIAAVIDFMSKSKLEYSIIDDTHPDECGGSVSICWVEKTFLHHVVLSYRNHID